MVKCNSYHITEETKYLTEFEQGVRFAKTGELITKEKVKVAHCWGTKNCEPCKCGGDECKCDFYPDVREEARKAAEEKKKAEPKFGEWISVKDSLPPIDQQVLVYTLLGRFAVDYRYSGSDEVENSGFRYYAVDFWTPLPEPPKK